MCCAKLQNIDLLEFHLGSLEAVVKKKYTSHFYVCLQEKEMEKQKTLYQQARLHERGAAEMVLQMVSASKGKIPSPGERHIPKSHASFSPDCSTLWIFYYTLVTLAIKELTRAVRTFCTARVNSSKKPLFFSKPFQCPLEMQSMGSLFQLRLGALTIPALLMQSIGPLLGAAGETE